MVQPGDTLSQIAARLGVPTDYLAGYNGITDSNIIYSGQPLYHLVGLGEHKVGDDVTIGTLCIWGMTLPLTRRASFKAAKTLSLRPSPPKTGSYYGVPTGS